MNRPAKTWSPDAPAVTCEVCGEPAWVVIDTPFRSLHLCRRHAFPRHPHHIPQKHKNCVAVRAPPAMVPQKKARAIPRELDHLRRWDSELGHLYWARPLTEKEAKKVNWNASGVPLLPHERAKLRRERRL